MSVGVAIIGSGIWAVEEHLPAIQASGDLTLKAVYSRTAKSAQVIASLSPGIDIYADDIDAGYPDLLRRDDISALVVSLAIGTQDKYIRDGLLAGKSILSEKPIAENVKAAEELVKWYRAQNPGPSWGVAENWRFLNSFDEANKEIKALGRILGFQVRLFNMVEKNWKFFNTSWRRTPSHQGGFLLDGGVHFVAGLRQMLEAVGDRVERVSAFTSLLQDHLPPVDTINAIIKTTSGVSGTFQVSFGTSLRGNEWTVACEHGVITVDGSEISMLRDGKKSTRSVPNERTGVPAEIRQWAQALVAGQALRAQDPESALADLEIIELMLRSGEQGGVPMDCRLQEV